MTTLRPATPEDRDFLYAVYASTRADEMALWGWPPAQQEMFLRMQYNARSGSYDAGFPDAVTSIIADSGVPAGAMIVDRGPAAFHLVDIALLPEFRNRGIGGRLLSGLVDEARAARVPVRLSVARGNPAIHLYSRLGFVVTTEDAMYLEMTHDL